MHVNLTYLLAQDHVNDLHRAADHDRLFRAATGSTRRSTRSIAAGHRTSWRRWPRPRRVLPLPSSSQH
jgi:hypothetical protein